MPVPFLGLTGGIGAGKSEALAALERLGAAVISTDRVVHELYRSGEVRDAVVERFGPEVAPAGEVDRAAVAERAFASAVDRRWLEELLWPRVGRRMAEWKSEMDRREPPPVAAVAEVPLLFEAGMEEAFDATIAVIAEEGIRERRAAARGHRSVDERHTRQLAQREKAARADHVVENHGSLSELQCTLARVLAKVGG